jgi:phosphatidate cytidylyltransferase
MLKQRVITAALLIPLIVLAILKMPTTSFQWLIALISILAAVEWFKIVGIKTQLKITISFITMFLIGIFSWLYLPTSDLVTISSMIWVLASWLVIRFAHLKLSGVIEKLFLSPLFGVAIAILVLISFWLSAITLHGSSVLGPQQLLYIMVAVWLADTGGYFAGKRWGKDALASVISPNKTWQGVYGALALTMIWAVLAYLLGMSGTISLTFWLILTAVTVLVSIIGDLFESLFKRSHAVKDSGNLLPGHGGMLDRIDSLVAAIPVFVVGLSLLGAL